ncbi:MAG: DNA mismatch repair endonuclease MutL [Bacteroidales bacterium]|nr:DNA mismatch repair endonuclease MutL [Bacteroidales bacterium]
MSDIIQLLPDHIANQIAAGEVIQRPASAIKELVENSVDAQASEIEIIIKDAGRTLMQVVDNGKGMSETDARLSFERHATSKLRTAEDLFNIQTLGFRGEALASIAAISHLELKSATADSLSGTHIILEGSKIIDQSPCSCQKGTSIAIKNLFFNVPARRSFLKSENVEFSHIVEEFYRIAIIHPDIAFSLYHNDKIIYKLPKSSLKSRIVGLLGKSYNEKMVTIEQETDFLTITGFVGKPDIAKKTKGGQYLFINKRFFRHPYIHNAISRAYQELIPDGYYPSYFILLEVDPRTIDVNVHPTKTEIKFQDEKLLYAVIHSTTKKALAENSLTPSLDFETEQFFDLNFPKDKVVQQPTIKIDPNYNPFSAPLGSKSTHNQAPDQRQISNLENWGKLYTPSEVPSSENIAVPAAEVVQTQIQDNDYSSSFIQLYNTYIVTKIKSGLILIHQNAAHERILYERFMKRMIEHGSGCQQLLFPITLELNPADAEILIEIKPELESIGFGISDFGKNAFLIEGTPSDIETSNIKEDIEKWIDSYKSNMMTARVDRKTNVASSISKNLAVKTGKFLSQEEMEALVNELFACAAPLESPGGKKTIKILSKEDLSQFFN